MRRILPAIAIPALILGGLLWWNSTQTAEKPQPPQDTAMSDEPSDGNVNAPPEGQSSAATPDATATAADTDATRSLDQGDLPPASEAAREAEAAAEAALKTASPAAEAAPEATTQAAVNATDIGALLRNGGTNLADLSRIIDASALTEIQKQTLHQLLRTAGDNPDLLRQALEYVEKVMQ